MSTTFNVYPHTEHVPAFGEVLHLATTRLQTFLAQQAIPQALTVELRLLTKAGNIDQPVNLAAPAIWPEDWYAWVSVPQRHPARSCLIPIRSTTLKMREKEPL